MIFYMFTDMKTQSTDLMYCGNAAEHKDKEVHISSKRYTRPPVRADPGQMIRMTDTK